MVYGLKPTYSQTVAHMIFKECVPHILHAKLNSLGCTQFRTPGGNFCVGKSCVLPPYTDYFLLYSHQRFGHVIADFLTVWVIYELHDYSINKLW